MADPRWEDVRDLAEKVIAEGHQELEQLLPPERIHFVRGEIAIARAVLALATPKAKDPAKFVQPAGQPGFVGPDY